MKGSTEAAAGGVRVKVCGIRRYEDARLALDLGAWAIGMIFHPASPRAIEPEEARRLVARLPRQALAVGVFVDRPAAEVQEIVDRAGLRGAQLHGAEPPEEAAAIRAEVVIKAFRVGPGFDAAAADRYPECLVLLDTYREGRVGGTGETFDWSVARELALRRPLILSGGIGPENASAALAAAHPWALDASSRLESAPGVKDPERLRRFFAEVAAHGGLANK